MLKIFHILRFLIIPAEFGQNFADFLKNLPAFFMWENTNDTVAR